MQQYYLINLFTDKGEFDQKEADRLIEHGRLHFYFYTPRNLNLRSAFALRAWLDKHQGVELAAHDKAVLHPQNHYSIGKNLAFYRVINENKNYLKHVSFHMGSLYGFGRKAQARIVSSLKEKPIDPSRAKERFFCVEFNQEKKNQFELAAISYIKKIRSLAELSGYKILLKNLSLDYVLATEENKLDFIRQHYKLEEIQKNLWLVPLMLEKANFPRHPYELLRIANECDVDLALDMEHLRFLRLVSQKYNTENPEALKRWAFDVRRDHREILDKQGYIISENKPIFYQKPIDLYESVFALKDRIAMVHLSGSIAPLFPDHDDINEDDLKVDTLLGLVDESKNEHLKPGIRQLSAIEGIEGSENDVVAGLYNSEQSKQLWQTRFKKQFLEDILLLKEIECPAIVQKMKNYSEQAIKTMEMFQQLSEIDI